MEAQRRLSAAWKESGKTSTSTSPKKTSPKRAAKCGATSRETSRYERGARCARSDLVFPALKKISSVALQSIRRTVEEGKPVYVSVETIYLVERGRLPLEALHRLEAGLKHI